MLAVLSWLAEILLHLVSGRHPWWLNPAAAGRRGAILGAPGAPIALAAEAVHHRPALVVKRLPAVDIVVEVIGGLRARPQA